MLTAILAAFAMSVADPKPAYVVPPSIADVRVYSADGDGNVGVGNNTHLHLSAQIATMGLEPKVLQPHVPARAQFITDENVIGAQASILRGFWESTKEFSEPKGRNCRVEIITPGNPARGSLTPEELELSRQLRWRTIVDQVAMPIVIALLNQAEFKDRARLRTLRRIVTEALTHNTKLIEDFEYEVYNQGSFKNGLSVIVNALFREIENGGLAGDLMVDGVRAGLKEALARWARRRAATSVHPYLKAADFVANLVDYGPDGIQIVKTVHDMGTTPAKLSFRVYFESAVDAIEPRVIRPARVEETFVLEGHQMIDEPGEPMTVTFRDRSGRNVHTSRVDWVLPNGSQAGVTVPGSYLSSATSPVRVTARFGGKEYAAGNEIRIVEQLDAPRLAPDEAMFGQPIEVHLPGLSRYLAGSKVMFGGAEGVASETASPDRVADGYLVVRVPNLGTAPPGGWRAWVRVESGRERLHSKRTPFILRDGTWRDHVEKLRAEAMPEATWDEIGVLSSNAPVAEITVPVAAGMQLVARLEEARGPSGGAEPLVKAMSMDVESLRGASTERHPVVEPVRDIRGPRPAVRIAHTTRGDLGAVLYRIRLEYGAGGPIQYRVRLQTRRCDDASTGADAPDTLREGMPIQTGITYRGSLFGEQRKFGEDLFDQYVISNVQQGQRVRLSLLDIQSDDRQAGADASLRGIYLSFLGRDGSYETVASYLEPLTFRDAQRTLVHEDARAGDYVVSVRNGSGNVRYSFRVDVGFDFGPSPEMQPIRSHFDAASDEGWRIQAGQEAPRAARWLGTSGKGWVAFEDQLGARSGPLDLMLVIDCTQSMAGLIDAVKARTREIVDTLGRKSSSLRVGAVFFSDIAATGLAASRRIAPLGDPQAALNALAAWGLQSGGSDPAEDLLHGLAGALDQPWRAGAAGRAIAFFTDNPAKLDANGKDAQGASIDSIVALARQKQVQIVAVPVRDDATLRSHSSQLASRTGGEVVPFVEAGQVVGVLAAAASGAIQRALPAYWIAPQKFCGDIGRFYGTSLSFRLAGAGRGKGFSGEDVVMEGGGLAIGLRAGARPRGTGESGPNWTTVTVPLSAVGHWRVLPSGERATREQVARVLADVRAIRVRAERFASDKASYLDAVELGTMRHTTDRGLTDGGQRDLDWMDETADAIQDVWRKTFETFTDIQRADAWLIEAIKPEPVPENLRFMVDSRDLCVVLETALNRQASTWALHGPMRALDAWIATLRRQGELRPDQRDALSSGIRAWNERVAALATAHRKLRDKVVRLTRLRLRQAQASPSEALAMGTSIQRAEDSVRAAQVDIGLIGGPTIPPPLTE